MTPLFESNAMQFILCGSVALNNTELQQLIDTGLISNPPSIHCCYTPVYTPTSFSSFAPQSSNDCVKNFLTVQP